MKEGHYYKISYVSKKGDRSYDNHCFEGLAIARKDHNNKLVLADTYWSLDGKDGRTFTRKDILKKIANEEIEVKHYVDSAKIEPIEKYNIDYYDDKDIFRLTRQHACTNSCIYFFKRKGAEKSAKKMKKVLLEKIATEEGNINYSQRQIKHAKENIEKIESGDLEVYI